MVPCGGEEEVGGAEVVGEDVGEFYAGSCCGDGSGINDGTQVVAMEGFGGDGGGGGIRCGGVDFAFVGAKVVGDFVFAGTGGQGGAGFDLAGAGAAGIEREELFHVRGRGELEIVCECVQGGSGLVAEPGELAEGCPGVTAFAVMGNVASGIVGVGASGSFDRGMGDLVGFGTSSAPSLGRAASDFPWEILDVQDST